MLMHFKSDQSGDFVMLSDVAMPLLKLMGMSGAPEGAVSGEALAQALLALQSGLSRLPRESEKNEEEEDDSPPPVALATRAVPLLEMLRRAQAADGYVMWQVD